MGVNQNTTIVFPLPIELMNAFRQFTGDGDGGDSGPAGPAPDRGPEPDLPPAPRIDPETGAVLPGDAGREDDDAPPPPPDVPPAL
jgi:hypothetical protein